MKYRITTKRTGIDLCPSTIFAPTGDTYIKVAYREWSWWRYVWMSYGYFNDVEHFKSTLRDYQLQINKSSIRYNKIVEDRQAFEKSNPVKIVTI